MGDGGCTYRGGGRVLQYQKWKDNINIRNTVEAL